MNQKQTFITKPLILIILDGWGYSNQYHGNAIKQANTPNLNFLWHYYPRTLLNASGEHVGLPNKQMGNSEVGHTTIGAGRTINQELVRISKEIENGNFFENKIIKTVYDATRSKKKKIHLIGLCSDGGVHSHINHLIALINISKQYQNLKTCIHIITDGRDTKPQNAEKFINKILDCINQTNNIKICTVSGRYYSMDRDCRWSRTQQTYNCLINNQINHAYENNTKKLIAESYKQQIYDEFILPTRINIGKIDEGDGLIFFNFRPDRMRQLVQSFFNESFQGFTTKKFLKLHIATFTTYDNSLNLPIIFPKNLKNNFLGQIISEKGLKQFRLAETEKYAHVTYFFNGGREEPFAGEDRQLIPSPSVNFYDSKPEMSAEQITNTIIKAINRNIYHLIIANYANPDMIGHTGNFNATKQSIEIIDKYIGKILKTIENKEIDLIITADHGNAEQMLDELNQTCKSHTNNLIPFILISSNNIYKLKQVGSLADIAPTILDLFNINIPQDMNGQSLIQKNHINPFLVQKTKSLSHE